MTTAEKRHLAQLYRQRNNAHPWKRWTIESTIERFKRRAAETALIATANRIYRQGP